MLSESYTFSWESKHQASEELKYRAENLQLCFRGFRLIKQININPGASQITSTPNERVRRTPYKIDWLLSQMVPVWLSSVIGGDSSPAPPHSSSSSVHQPSHQILISSSAALQTRLGWRSRDHPTFSRQLRSFNSCMKSQEEASDLRR